jgi:hypothetical protein
MWQHINYFWHIGVVRRRAINISIAGAADIAVSSISIFKRNNTVVNNFVEYIGVMAVI